GASGGGGGCGISPGNRYFVDVVQAHDVAPSTELVDAANGMVVTRLAQSDLSKFSELALKKAEMFTYTAADGKTTLRGTIQFPSTFDPSRQYPVLVSTYGGPEFSYLTARETFVSPSSIAELGFLIVNLDSRAVPNLGK